jgi:uncharacterized membrane protein YphA (DoxX/SURF4 family)
METEPAMNRLPSLLARVLLGGFFLAAGVQKLFLPQQTLSSVYSYQLPLPDGLAVLVAAALPWMEILLGAALLLRLWPGVTLAWTLLLLVLFLGLTTMAWARGLAIDCGCLDLSRIHPSLKVLSTPGGAALRNLVLLGIAAGLWFCPHFRAGKKR